MKVVAAVQVGAFLVGVAAGAAVTLAVVGVALVTAYTNAEGMER